MQHDCVKVQSLEFNAQLTSLTTSNWVYIIIENPNKFDKKYHNFLCNWENNVCGKIGNMLFEAH